MAELKTKISLGRMNNAIFMRVLWTDESLLGNGLLHEYNHWRIKSVDEPMLTVSKYIYLWGVFGIA